MADRIEIFKGCESGGIPIRVYMDFDELNSSVEFPEDPNPYHIITIGCNSMDWDCVFDGMMHELMEFNLIMMNSTFNKFNNIGNDSGDALFVFDHATFSEVVFRTSSTMNMFLPKATKLFNKRIKNATSK